LTKKEAVILLDNPPTNFDAKNYTFGKYHNSKMKTEEKIPELKKSLDEWTTGKPLHAGKLQGETSSKRLNFPEPLLCILFILRYAITDEQSLTKLKSLLSVDYTPPVKQYTEINFYKPEWLSSHFVCNIVEIVDTFMGASTGPVQTQVLRNSENTASRMRMALLHTTTKTFVNLLLKFGPNPKLPNIDHEDFIQYLKDRSATNSPTTAMEVILDALPQLVQETLTTDLTSAIAGVPNIEHCLTMKWKEENTNPRNPVPKITVDSFQIIIVAKVYNGIVTCKRAQTITEFVENMLGGNITFSEMPKPPIRTPETTSKQSQKRSSGGGGGGDTPTKKTRTLPQLNTTSIETNLQAIEQAAQGLNGTNQAIKTSITTAVNTIRSDLVTYQASRVPKQKKSKGNDGSNQ
jgi:hypothetical protein